MPARRGAEALIKRGDGAEPETFATLGGLRNLEITLNKETADVTTSDDLDANQQLWRSKLSTVGELGVSAEFIPKDLIGGQSLYQDFVSGAIKNYQIVIPNIGTFTLPMILTAMPFSAPFDGESSASVTLESAGPPEFEAET